MEQQVHYVDAVTGADTPLLSEHTVRIKDHPCFFCGSITDEHYNYCSEVKGFTLLAIVLVITIVVVWAKIWCAKHRDELD